MGVESAAAAVEVVDPDGGAVGVGLDAVVARGADRDVEATIWAEEDGAGEVITAAGQVGDDDLALEDAEIRGKGEAGDTRLLADVEITATEGEAGGIVETAGDDHAAGGDAGVVGVEQRNDVIGAAIGDEEGAIGAEGDEAGSVEAVGEDGGGVSRWQMEGSDVGAAADKMTAEEYAKEELTVKEGEEAGKEGSGGEGGEEEPPEARHGTLGRLCRFCRLCWRWRLRLRCHVWGLLRRDGGGSRWMPLRWYAVWVPCVQGVRRIGRTPGGDSAPSWCVGIAGAPTVHTMAGPMLRHEGALAVGEEGVGRGRLAEGGKQGVGAGVEVMCVVLEGCFGGIAAAGVAGARGVDAVLGAGVKAVRGDGEAAYALGAGPRRLVMVWMPGRTVFSALRTWAPARVARVALCSGSSGRRTR